MVIQGLFIREINIALATIRDSSSNNSSNSSSGSSWRSLFAIVGSFKLFYYFRCLFSFCLTDVLLLLLSVCLCLCVYVCRHLRSIASGGPLSDFVIALRLLLFSISSTLVFLAFGALSGVSDMLTPHVCEWGYVCPCVRLCVCVRVLQSLLVDLLLLLLLQLLLLLLLQLLLFCSACRR